MNSDEWHKLPEHRSSLQHIERRLATDVPGTDMAALPAVSTEVMPEGNRAQQQVQADAFVSAIERTTQRG